MRRPRIQTLASCLTGLLLVLLSTPSASAQCTAPSNWFPHSSTPAPNDNADFSTNCDFHQWSWQMFLWLTQTTGPDGQLRFETFPTPTDLFASTDKTLVPHARLPKSKVLRLRPRSTKSSGPTGLEDINQAGSNGILVDQNGRAVYYSQHINDVYYNFIRDNDYNIPANYIAAPPTQDFPVGSLELKVSWVIADGPTELYTRLAEIEVLVEQDNKISVDPTQTASVTVGLVGMHIVGIVNGHPEFIWATFERTFNAPNLPAGTQPTDPVSNRDWRFYQANTLMEDCNLPNAGEQTLDPATQTIAPVSNAYLQYAFGGGSQDNQRNILSLNQSVLSGLSSDPIWGRYKLIGATWIPANTLQPNQSQYGKALGSNRLSNVTMETFTQPSFNCFGCHTTFGTVENGVKIPGLNMNLSHIMLDGITQGTQKAARARKAARSRQ